MEAFTGTTEEIGQDWNSQGAKTLSEDQKLQKRTLPGKFFTGGRKCIPRHLPARQGLPHRSKGKPGDCRDGSVIKDTFFPKDLGSVSTSYMSVVPVPENSTPFLVSTGTRHAQGTQTDRHAGKTCFTYIK